MKHNLLTNSIALLLLVAVSFQCSKDNFDRYEDPPWLGGTNIETLEKAGTYNHFVALMDKADYRTSIENQLFTLFVPSDSVFEIYFQKKGISSIEDLTIMEAEELFGQHILINPRSREHLMFEYAWGELQDPQGEYGTLFHRKETYSIPLDYTEEVKYHEEFQGQTLGIYRGPTMVPLWTTEYFEDYFGKTDGSDYLFMYPESSWSGTQWHDAMVTEAEVRTSSGFIYYLDRVVEPIPTIETYLKDNQDEFGLFYDIAQRFASYTSPSFNEQDERRYRKGYTQILNFANEAGPDPNAPANMLYMFSSFIPYDNVLQDFLDNTALQYYETIDSVPPLFLVYVLQSHLNRFLSLPSKMEERFQNYYGDQVSIDINADIDKSIMCSNGIIYAMNKFIEPNAFTCVPGPVFYNNNYTTFLYALEFSGLLSTITRPEIDVTLFAASNDELLEYGIRENEIDGQVFLEIRSSAGVWNPMLYLDIQDFVRDYIHFGKIEDFTGEGYIQMASDNYLHFQNGQIEGGGNQIEEDYCSVLEKIESEINGNLFYLDNSIKAPDNAAEILLTDPDLSSFADLLYQVGQIDSVQADYELPGIEYPRVIFLSELNQWTVLAPTNQALADAELAGLIPEDEDDLRDFIFYHFVRGNSVFDDGLFSGEVNTHRIDTVIGAEIFYEHLNFSNSVNSLNVTDLSEQTISINHSDANILIEGGVLHKINSILQIEP